MNELDDLKQRGTPNSTFRLVSNLGTHEVGDTKATRLNMG
jgi:hypothetical protein